MSGQSRIAHDRMCALVATFAIISTVVAAAAPALAQDSAEPPDKAAAPSPVAKESSPEGTPAVVLDDQGVESLLGKEVTSATGEKLGRIDDVLVAKDGTLRAAVVDFGGFLGVGTRKVAVAWATLTFADKGPVLNMTTDELRVTPEYRTGEPVVVVGKSATKDERSRTPPK